MATETFDSPSSSATTWTAPTNQTITIILSGPGGGQGGESDTNTADGGYSGGSGGYLKMEYSASAGETLEIWAGGGGGNGSPFGGPGSGGTGWYSGGYGGPNSGASDGGPGGGGGGATAVKSQSDGLIAVAGGGGGGGGLNYNYSGSSDSGSGGGGGAICGAGGTSGSGGNDGAWGGGCSEPDGVGGDGGSGSPNKYDEPGGGGPGSQATYYGTILNQNTGGGGGQNEDGYVEITYSGINPPSSVSSSLNSDGTVSVSWTDDSNSEDNYEIYRSTSSNVTTGATTSINEPDDNTYSSVRKSGVVINPNAGLAGVEIELAQSTQNASTAYITDSNANLIASSSITNRTAKIFTNPSNIIYPLNKGTEYWVVVDNNDSSYQASRKDVPDSSTPFTGTDLDILGYGEVGSGTTSKSTYYTENIKSVTALKQWETLAGTVGANTTSFSDTPPNNSTYYYTVRVVNQQDAAASSDKGSVEYVYVNYYNGSSWVRASPKIYDGTSWVFASDVSHHDGSNWN